MTRGDVLLLAASSDAYCRIMGNTQQASVLYSSKRLFPRPNGRLQLAKSRAGGMQGLQSDPKGREPENGASIVCPETTYPVTPKERDRMRRSSAVGYQWQGPECYRLRLKWTQRDRES
jgi:hypothetical protein